MISVIVPTYKEISFLSSALDAVRANTGRHEVLVVEAASEDGTSEVVAAYGGQFFLCPRRQRAAQMNFGAQYAGGETLIFLHADTLLPATAFAKIDEALRNPAVAGGAFARMFQSPFAFSLFHQLSGRAAISRFGLVPRRSSYFRPAARLRANGWISRW